MTTTVPPEAGTGQGMSGRTTFRSGIRIRSASTATTMTEWAANVAVQGSSPPDQEAFPKLGRETETAGWQDPVKKRDTIPSDW
jgi:hypothetical protein